MRCSKSLVWVACSVVLSLAACGEEGAGDDVDGGGRDGGARADGGDAGGPPDGGGGNLDGGGGGNPDAGGGDAGANDAGGPTAHPTFEADVLALVNARRAQGATCGDETFGSAGPLSIDAKLATAARAHSFDMYDRNFFDHTNPDGDSPGDRIEALGYSWSRWGENIAGGQSTPAGAMQTWMNSPGHCANIMNPHYTHIGIGFYANRWTQVFATPL